MKQILLSIFTVLTLVACNQKSGYVVQGDIVNMTGDQLILERYSSNETVVVDTATITDGNFKMEGPLEKPGLFSIRPQKSRGVVVYLEPGSKVNVSINFDEIENYSVSGSKESEEIREFQSNFQKMQQEKERLVDEFRTSTNKDSIRNLVMKADADNEIALREMVRNAKSPYVAILMISTLDPNRNKEAYQAFAERLSLELPNSEYTSHFQSISEELASKGDKPNIGQIAPNIAMANPDGKVLNLTDLRGKYVLLDFWAAWCGPCRRENPNLVRAYKDFNKDGFEIFSVSLDRTENAWKKAIVADDLMWNYHVSDLKYWNNEAARAYGINSIPASFLLDPEGKVIATDLRGDLLQDKLNSIFK